jgi:hypothetical protein
MACRLGFNARGMVHYGVGASKQVQRNQGTQPGQIRQTLERIRELNGSIVRVYVGNSRMEPEAAAGQLQALLEQASQFDVQVIASLLDLYYPKKEDSWFTPLSRKAYTVDLDEHLDCLGPAFFAGEYVDSYLPFVRAVVEANKEHKSLFAWEPGNELTTGSRDDFLKFMKDTTELIHKLDPHTPISAGVLTATHALNQTDGAAQDLYEATPRIHFATAHYYLMNEDGPDRRAEGRRDAEWALAHGRSVIVEEFGPTQKPENAKALRDEIEDWKARGASAIILWGYHLGVGQEDLLFEPANAPDQAQQLQEFPDA